MTTELRRSLGAFRGAALLLNIVIGAGLLTLPGLAIKVAGDQAVWAWLVCAAASLPLLGVFIVLGRRYPDAGGITAYAGRAFGTFGWIAATLLFLGAVAFGLPMIALTGGYYLAAVTGASPHLLAAALIVSALMPHLLPGDGAGKAMALIASAVLAVVIMLLGIGLFGAAGSAGRGAVGLPIGFDHSLAFAPFMLLFFAFTGWEVGAGMTEEFRNPSRDYPAAMLLSFAVATGLYIAIAMVAQRTDLSGAFEAPFIAIIRPVLGSSGVHVVVLTAALIIFANLSGAIWGVSRLVFSLGRDGLLPERLGRTRGGRPIAAVVATTSAILLVLGLDHAWAFGMERLLGLAGQNFLILCGIAAAALFALTSSVPERLLALAAALLVSALVMLQGPTLAYPIGLILTAAVATFWRRARLVAPKRGLFGEA